jgi:glc operon protein GlcG
MLQSTRQPVKPQEWTRLRLSVMSLTLAEANLIIKGAIERAQQLNLNVSAAVCDECGRLIAFNRMDGTYEDISRLSIGKAIVSAGSGLPSCSVSGLVRHTPVDIVVNEGAPVMCAQGGLPILRDGKIEGACGVAGARSHEQDEECARMGIANLER